MRQLNICIDIDGTITEPYYWLPYANSYFKLNVHEDDVTEYDIAKVLNISKEEYLKFYEDKKIQIHTEEKLRNDAGFALDILYMFNNIYFVTARDKSMELLTSRYLKKHHIPHDGLFVLGSCDKTHAAKKLDCDVFIEDSYDNAIQLSECGFTVLLLDTNYNRHSLNERITRVYSWKDILQFISELSSKKEEAV